MFVSQFIIQLEALRDKHGDLKCLIADMDEEHFQRIVDLGTQDEDGNKVILIETQKIERP